ncbi:MAG: tetratricopeptide repeat protein [Alphaproteobacteria bacterium]|nr:tetratricopeptide repeat protein [Alphaproteobacteria bacterium]
MADGERRLAAIVATDIAGYSRLMGADEAGTLARLKEHRGAAEATGQAHGGRIVGTAGDSILWEFPSVVEAVTAAIETQALIAERNEGLPDDRKMLYRVGINLGDVLVDGDEIYGDGVNVAARLEALAEPGGICVSRTVRNEVRDRMDIAFDSLGQVAVKNIARPIRVYRVLAEGEEAATPARGSARRRRYAAAAVVVLAIVAAGGAWWWWQPGPEPAEQATFAHKLPDKPSIAVLPFANLSDDKEQEYFADGMTDDLITHLSKVNGLFVIARNSVFTYKGKNTKVQDVARDLGVRYVLEGSVRRAGGTVRINAQLIDAETGGHVWADLFDRDMRDIFALQDEVIKKIVQALAITLTPAERTQLVHRPTDDLEAYDYYLRAERRLYGHGITARGEAITLYEKAIGLDPEFAVAHAGIAMAAVDIWRYEYSHVLPGPVARKRAYVAASKALKLDSRNARAFSVLGVLRVVEGRYDEAIEAARLAVSLDPSNSEAYVHLATVLTYAGEHPEALAAMETALRLNPKPPRYYFQELGLVLFHNKRYARALEPLQTARAGGAGHLQTSAMVLAQLGRFDEAKAQVKKLLRIVPFANLAYYRALYRHYRRDQDLEHRMDALRKAGLPAWPFGYEGRAEDRLDANALAALTFGRTWIGRDTDGAPFVQQASAEGAVAFRSDVSLLTGTVWIEGGMLCTHFPATLVDRKACSYIFRNPIGTAEAGNEYIKVGLGSVLYFSAKP